MNLDLLIRTRSQLKQEEDDTSVSSQEEQPAEEESVQDESEVEEEKSSRSSKSLESSREGEPQEETMAEPREKFRGYHYSREV